jgi:hypothetical protein
MPADLVAANVAGVLDLCRPPHGFVYRTGIWLSHDVDMAMVADTVAPVLADTSDPDPQRRRRLAAAAREGDAELVVLGRASRLWQVTAFPWATFVPVGGRVQHAKCGVLQFAKPSSSKRITRAFVTSANLTRGGLSNREVLVWEEAGSQKTGPTLARDLIRVMRTLTVSLSDESRGRVRSVLKALAAGLPSSSPAGCIVESLSNSQPLLAGIATKASKPADRLVIVSPPFAGDADHKAAVHLLPWVQLGTRVDVYTGVEAEHGATLHPSCRPAFSSAVLEMLAAASGAKVQVWGVPTYDTDGRRRPLHAKVIAAVHGDSATVVAGSANCTGRGLGGENRELVVRQDWPLQRLEAWIGELDAIRFDGEVESPAPREEPNALPAALVEVTASFVPDSGQRVGRGKWRGTLRLGPPDRPGALRILYRGARVPNRSEQHFVLWEREAWLTAVVGKSERRVPIVVHALDPDFWETSPDSEDGEDPVLLALLRALRPSSTPQSSHQGSQAGDGAGLGTGLDDRYRIEPRQALTLFARKRVQLREWLTDGLGSGGKDLFPEEAERRVAEALLGSSPQSSSTLLGSLAATVGEFDGSDVERP